MFEMIGLIEPPCGTPFFPNYLTAICLLNRGFHPPFNIQYNPFAVCVLLDSLQC
ncbi:hypothetical protein [Wolbachia pipientis]|uniref:hypothetical protein n=1 Tax=Wolbachia pipientis TaxID=955 RepID=UPI0021751D10|nr:hypothetical protein [Wolbachia pipientis]